MWPRLAIAIFMQKHTFQLMTSVSVYGQIDRQIDREIDYIYIYIYIYIYMYVCMYVYIHHML